MGTAAQEQGTAGVTSEEQFIADFAARLDIPDGGSSGSASGAAPAKGQGQEQETDDEGGSDDSAARPRARGTEGGQRDGAGASPADEQTGDEEEDTEGAGDDDAPAGEQRGTEAGAADDEGTDDDEESGEFDDALKRHGAALSLEDLPAEARPLVERKLAGMEAAFTKAMQEARAYRQREAKILAEDRYRREHPAAFIVEMLEADPKLYDAVNAELDKIESDPAAKATSVTQREQARKQAADAVAAEQQRADARAKRGQEVQDYTERAAQKAGVPFDFVEEAVVLAIGECLRQGKDITDAEIDAVIAEKAKAYRRHVVAHRREERKSVFKGKAADRKAKPVVRSGQGNSPSPAPKKADSGSLEENMMATADRLFPGAP